MRIRSMTAVGAAVGVLAGCGGGGSNPVADVHNTLHQFVGDLVSGNYAGACSEMTESARSELGGTQCAQRLGEAMQFTSKTQISAAKAEEAKINSFPVTVHGDTATLTNGSGGAPTQFVRQNGHWLLTGAAASK